MAPPHSSSHLHLHPHTNQTLNRSGEAASPTKKSITQQARHCWSFALVRADKSLSNADVSGRAAAASRSAWDFMTKHMKGPGGTWCVGLGQSWANKLLFSLHGH